MLTLEGNLIPDVDTSIEPDSLIAGVSPQDNQDAYQNQTEDHDKVHGDED